MNDNDEMARGPRRPRRAPAGAETETRRRKQPGPPKKQVDAQGQVTCIRYGKVVTAKICERIADGEAWHRICNRNGLPAYGTLYDWVKKYPDFAEAYAQAREMAADRRADEALLVAQAATAATVQADRLYVNTLQWRAAKGAPRRYGARAEAAEAGEVRDGPRLIIEVRRFEKAHRPDGSVYAREILPNPKGRR
jgi:hypothetical protein